MRELAVRIRFQTPSLGHVKAKGGLGRFVFPRDPDGHIIFLATWHASNMRFAAQTLMKHQAEVEQIRWDVKVDGLLRPNRWHRRYFSGDSRRYALHEPSFLVRSSVSIAVYHRRSVTRISGG